MVSDPVRRKTGWHMSIDKQRIVKEVRMCHQVTRATCWLDVELQVRHISVFISTKYRDFMSLFILTLLTHVCPPNQDTTNKQTAILLIVDLSNFCCLLFVSFKLQGVFLSLYRSIFVHVFLLLLLSAVNQLGTSLFYCQVWHCLMQMWNLGLCSLGSTILLPLRET